MMSKVELLASQQVYIYRSDKTCRVKRRKGSERHSGGGGGDGRGRRKELNMESGRSFQAMTLCDPISLNPSADTQENQTN